MNILIYTILIYTILNSGKYFSGHAEYFGTSMPIKPLYIKLLYISIAICFILLYIAKLIPLYIPATCVIGMVLSTVVWKDISLYAD